MYIVKVGDGTRHTVYHLALAQQLAANYIAAGYTATIVAVVD